MCIQICAIKKGGFNASHLSLIHLSIHLAHAPITSHIQGLYCDPGEQFRTFRLRYRDPPSRARIWLSVLFLKEEPS